MSLSEPYSPDPGAVRTLTRTAHPSAREPQRRNRTAGSPGPARQINSSASASGNASGTGEGHSQAGALVISLDFEIHWGMRDKESADGAYREALLGVLEAVPRILAEFASAGIAATWATVGFLFTKDATELADRSPGVRPAYRDARLDPYLEPIGQTEQDDPLHFAPTLIEAIRRCPRQELATHTFSHFYCRAPQAGDEQQTALAFDADLAAAVNLMRDRGLACHSIVFPRNQHNPAFDGSLRRHGIECYRGNPTGWLFQGDSGGQRAGRLIDSCVEVTGHHTYAWSDLIDPNSGLVNVPASALLRPWSRQQRWLSNLQMSRLCRSMTWAAQRGRLFHLWWHPHNFGVNVAENIALLRRLLDHASTLGERHGFQSLSMRDAAHTARTAARSTTTHCCNDAATGHTG